MANFSEFRVQMSVDLEKQVSFEPRYNSLVSPSTFNYMAGGPEYPRFYSDEPETRWRRHPKAAVLDPDRFCKSVARNCLMQMASHWTTLPIARNLAVRYQALRNAYMMVGRKRAAGRPMAETATQFLDAAKRIFDRLSEGTVRIHNHRVPINGDVAMLRWADDLHADERELLELYRARKASVVVSMPLTQASALCLATFCSSR
jgi:hypothetical protein